MDSRTKVREAQKATLDHLAQCEECIAELYAAYGAAFPAAREFWRGLAEEERGHARMLKSLHRLLDQGGVLFNIGRFDRQATDTMVAMIAGEETALKSGSYSIEQSYKAAVHVETSLLEGHFYDLVTSDAREFQIMAEHLSTATQRHRKHLQEQLLEADGNRE